MAFDSGNELQARKLYTGLGDVTVVMINPTLAELQENGVNFKEEPTYVSEVDGVKKVRLDIWVNHPIVGLQKAAFFLADESKLSAAGNAQFINSYGQASWAATAEALLEKLTWYNKEGIRLAKSGEPELIDFIKSLLSIPKEGKAEISNISKLFTGDVSELKKVFTTYKDRKVQVLFIVKQSKGEWYQNIYTRYFSRAGTKSTTYWAKHLAGSTTTLMYQDSFALKEFNPMEFTDTTEDSSSKDPWA